MERNTSRRSGHGDFRFSFRSSQDWFWVLEFAFFHSLLGGWYRRDGTRKHCKVSQSYANSRRQTIEFSWSGLTSERKLRYTGRLVLKDIHTSRMAAKSAASSSKLLLGQTASGEDAGDEHTSVLASCFSNRYDSFHLARENCVCDREPNWHFACNKTDMLTGS